jgi:transposase-like protein
MRNPFKYFKASPEIIRLAMMMYIRFSLSLRNVEGLLHEPGIDITHETVHFLVEQIWTIVRQIDPKTARPNRQ